MIVVAAFEPFGGRRVNRSLEVARAAASRLGLRVHVLPVRFDRLARAVEALLRPPPDVLLLMGEHGRARAFHVERVAANAIEPRIADNAGKKPHGPVRRGGPAARVATLPARSALATLARHAPSRLSDDAGRFACNASLYLALDLAAVRRLRTRIGFVHVPVRQVRFAGAVDAVEALLRRLEARGRARRRRRRAVFDARRARC
jgi:pyroglutamyl-peptidase